MCKGFEFKRSYPQQNKHKYAYPTIGCTVLVQFLASTTPKNNGRHDYLMNEQTQLMPPPTHEILEQFQMSACNHIAPLIKIG